MILKPNSRFYKSATSNVIAVIKHVDSDLRWRMNDHIEDMLGMVTILLTPGYGRNEKRPH